MKDKKESKPLPDDYLDWDTHIAIPPPRPKGTIKVKLVYAGRRKPLPIDDPREI